MAKPYDQIPDRRAIVRRRALEDALATLVEDLPTGAEPPRPAVLALLRDALAVGRAEIRRRFEEPGPLRNDGDQVLAATSFLMDQLIRVIFDFADQRIYPAANPSAAERLGVVATGGYGRGELAPLSDIDPAVPAALQADAARRADRRVHALPAVGPGPQGRPRHATVDESLRYAERDQTIRTALLEARYVWGDRELFDELIKGFAQKFLTGDGRDFVEAKLAERDQRHQRMGDSATSSSPTSRRARAGCATCISCCSGSPSISIASTSPANWWPRACSPRTRRAISSAPSASSHGALPHPLSDRPRRRPLSFDLQREIAARLGYQDRPGSRGVERFTKHYYLHAKMVGDLTRIFVAALEDSRRRKPKLAALWQTLRPRARGLPPRRRAAGRRRA